ncbi:MAG: DUF1592 domain-containing protein [Myxococcota bacterium]
MTDKLILRGMLVGLWSLAGCYTGFNAELGGGAASGAGITDGAADGGDGDGDSGDGLDPDDPASQCMDADVGATSLRRLTASQYDHTIRDLLGLDGGYTADFTPDEHIGAFKSNGSASVGELQVEQYLTAAEAVATDATADLGLLLDCDVAVEGDACAESFLADFAMKAYRRPLEAGELDRVLGVYQTGKAEASGDVTNGLRIAISAVLQSPFFLYHVEFGAPGAGDEMVALTGYELASRLSYFLWDSMPDDALFAAAGEGTLDDADGVRAQVERMLASPKAEETIAAFHTQWLGVAELEHVEKNPEMFPGYDSTLAASMKKDVADFARWVMLEGDGRLDTLLTANMTLTDDPRLLELYGVTPPPGHVAGTPIELPADQRAGLLTMPGVMAEHAHPDQTSPIHRGVMIRQNFFCQQLPPPPPDVDDAPPSPDPNATTRERFAEHTSDPTCAGCHVLIDPLGFGLEGYDAIGAFRTEEDSGLAVDDSGEITASDVNGTFAGGVELAGMLSESGVVRECVSRQWFRYALGRIESDADDCSIEHIATTFDESNYDVRVLLREITLSTAFRFRKGAA